MTRRLHPALRALYPCSTNRRTCWSRPISSLSAVGDAGADGKREPKMKLPRPNVASRAVVQSGTSNKTADSPPHGSPSAPPSEERTVSHALAPASSAGPPVSRKAPALKMVGQPSPITADGPPGPTHWVLRLKSKEEFQAALTKYQQCAPHVLARDATARVRCPHTWGSSTTALTKAVAGFAALWRACSRWAATQNPRS